MSHTPVHTSLKHLPKLLVFLLFVVFKTTYAQQPNITFREIKTACNGDGKVEITVSGVPLPANIEISSSVGVVTHTTTSAGLDTISGFDGRYLYVNLPGSQLYKYFYGTQPFTYSFYDTLDAICPALGGATVKVTGAADPYTIEWFDENGAIVDTGLRGQLPAGEYGVRITDANGCVNGSYTLGRPDNIFMGVQVHYRSGMDATITTTLANCTNGTAMVSNVIGGISPYTYAWGNGANTAGITQLRGGYHSVTITDAQGCYYKPYVYVQQSVTITANATITNATCLESNGSAIAFGSGGATPYSYLWSNGQQTQTATGMVKGTYYVTATDANGCTGSKYVPVNSSTPITVTYTAKPSLCTAATGTATLSITGGTAPYLVKWNTYPPQTGVTASGLAEGTYYFNVTDAVGCVRTGTAYVPPVSVIRASVNSTEATCTQSNGSATVYVSGGSVPYAYEWNTGAVTKTISGLAANYYRVTITDAMSCKVTKGISIGSYSPVKLRLAPSPAGCLFSADGSITAYAYGGTPPYNYNGNGSSGQTLTGLATGRYYAYVSDASGCTAGEETTVPYNTANNSCYCTITGRVYVDANTNCIFDQGEEGVSNIMIHASGLGYTFTNSDGIYSFKAPSGTYTISESVKAFYPLAPCQSNAIEVTATAASNCTIVQNFANSVNPIHDIQLSNVKLSCFPVVGFEYTQRVVVKNNGTVDEPSIQTGYRHDGQFAVKSKPAIMTLQNSAADPNWYGVSTGFPSLQPGEAYTMDIKYQVPTNIPLNTEVNFYDTATNDAPIVMNWLTDYSPWDNVRTLVTHTVGSFDPNDKQVTPLGDGADGFINTTDSILTYAVRFQNTGNYPASKVVVVDTLDADLDITTLTPVYGTHKYTTDMSEAGIVKFTFDNINLPDSNSNPNGSIGVIQYQIRQERALAGGTRISSPASIYFDFNTPIRTNIAVNTIKIATDISEPALQPFTFNLYPNPSNGIVNLAIRSELAARCSLSFYNMLGEVVQMQPIQMERGENTVQANTQKLLPGIYQAVVTDGHYSFSRKVTILE